MHQENPLPCTCWLTSARQWSVHLHSSAQRHFLGDCRFPKQMESVTSSCPSPGSLDYTHPIPPPKYSPHGFIADIQVPVLWAQQASHYLRAVINLFASLSSTPDVSHRVGYWMNAMNATSFCFSIHVTSLISKHRCKECLQAGMGESAEGWINLGPTFEAGWFNTRSEPTKCRCRYGG